MEMHFDPPTDQKEKCRVNPETKGIRDKNGPRVLNDRREHYLKMFESDYEIEQRHEKRHGIAERNRFMNPVLVYKGEEITPKKALMVVYHAEKKIEALNVVLETEMHHLTKRKFEKQLDVQLGILREMQQSVDNFFNGRK